MASRREQKEQRRREREELERRIARERTRRARLRIAGLLLAVAVVAGGLLALRPWEEDPPPPFAYAEAGLADRLDAAGVRFDAGARHIHPTLRVSVRGRPVTVPANMGLGATMAPIHTHEPDGVIHVEGAGDPTLAKVLALWGVTLTPDQLGPYRANGVERVRMWTKAPGSKTFQETDVRPDLPVKDRMEVQLAFGTDAQSPIL